MDLLPPVPGSCVPLRSYSQRALTCPCPPRNSGTRVIVSGKHGCLALCSIQSLPTLREPWVCAGSSAFFPDKSASAYNKTHSGVKRVDIQACRVSLINNKKRLAPGRLHQRLAHLWSFSVWINFKRPINKWFHAFKKWRKWKTTTNKRVYLLQFGPFPLLPSRRKIQLFTWWPWYPRYFLWDHLLNIIFA